MANNGLAATLTSDQGKLHSVLTRVEPGGEIKVKPNQKLGPKLTRM